LLQGLVEFYPCCWTCSDQWADIAQFVIAGAAAVAVIVATVELWRSRTNARRVRAYQYSDRFNQLEMRRMAGEYRSLGRGERPADDKLNVARRVKVGCK
jgi:hypothetical protein